MSKQPFLVYQLAFVDLFEIRRVVGSVRENGVVIDKWRRRAYQQHYSTHQ